MPDHPTRSRTFVVHFKDEVDAQWAATTLGAHPGVVSILTIDGKTEAVLRTVQARVAPATPQQR